jgi:hypothetical protein
MSISPGSSTIAFHLPMWGFFCPSSVLFSFFILCLFFSAMQCQHLEAPSKGTMDCVHPLAAFAYGSSCKFECQSGYRVRGLNTLHCSGSGQWTAPLPACEGRIFFFSSLQYTQEGFMAQ